MTHANAVAASPARPLGIRVAAAFVGALAVAVAAQVAIPVVGSPVPFTLQPLAVLIVGGLLGPRMGALSLVMYLAMGAMGLPVFAPIGLPGVARLFGPTGGYLIAYPVAAMIVGLSVSRSVGKADIGTQRTDLPTYRLTVLSCLAGMVVVHLGGASQLLILTGSASGAFAAGVLPFVLNDLVKSLVAALVIRRLHPRTRALS